MKKLVLYSVALLFIFVSKVGAQTIDPFHLPPAIPVPEWVKQTDWSTPNVHKIDSLIHIYASNNKAHRDDNEGEMDFHEDPYVTAYIRWRTLMMPCIQNDGTVKYDPNVAREKLIQSTRIAKSQSTDRTTTASNWTLLGPVQTYRDNSRGLANEQNNMYCIAIAPSNSSILYAASEPGTMYKSTDKGLHWASITDPLYSCQASTIAINPTNPNVVYAYDAMSNSILKTLDGGATWRVLTSYTHNGGDRMIISPVTGRILITGSDAIYYSDDTGTTWTAATGTGIMTDICFDPSNPDTVYSSGTTSTTGTGYLILKLSVNGGTTFTDVTGGLGWLNTGGSRIAVTKANSNYVYCANIGGTSAPRIIRSTNRGLNWTITASSVDSISLGGTSVSTGLGMSNGQGYYDFDIVVSPRDSLSIIVGTCSSFKSVDGGFNFIPIGGYMGNFPLHPDIQQAVANDTDTYLAMDGGINYSSDFFTNMSNYSVRNNNLRSGDFWGFGQGWDQDIVVGGRYHNGDVAIYDAYGGGSGLSLGGGEDATGHLFHGQNAVAGFRDIGTLQLPSSLAGTIQYSGSFVANSLWPSDDYYGLFSSKLMVDPRYSNVYYVGQDSILWVTENYGSSYSALHNFGSGNSVWRFDIARSNYNVMWVTTTNGIYKTTDAGASWSAVTIPVSYSYYNTDVVINPLNENNVYFCMANAAAANKVFETGNGGTTWTNITGTVCNNKAVAFLQYHGGTNGGLYAITNGRPSYVFYRDSTMSDWIPFSTGLPDGLAAREGALIFYRDSKIRICGNTSIFTSPTYATGAPVAQPMADRQRVSCASDTVNFYDYSMYNYAGATRLWSFPGALWVSSYTALTPKVLYPGPGSYSVSLKVTNAALQTNTRTVANMITFDTGSLCGPDTVAGLCAQMFGNGQTISLGLIPIDTNTFSISAWIQPQGNQASFSQIVSHDAYPGSTNFGFGMGFIFDGYTRNLELCYTDSTVNYGNTSGLICDSTQWNFVTLTYAPTGVTMYLNGKASIVNPGPMPSINLSQTPFYLNFDAVIGQGSNYKGKIDEVKFYNYTLSQNEVRQKMHLIQNPAAAETGLIAYYQFNQYDIVSGLLHDAFGKNEVSVPASNIVRSTAPVATGTVFRNPLVNAAGLNSFPTAHVNMYLPTGGTYPAGEMVAFHLWSNPDSIPGRLAVPGYFVINNYGTNTTFSVPDSINFGDLHISSSAFTGNNFKLFQRSYGAFGNSWGSVLDSATNFYFSAAGSSLTYNSGTGINHLFSQLVIMNSDTAALGITKTPTTNQPQWHISELYPNPVGDWTKVDITAPEQGTYEAIMTITDITGKQLQQLSQKLSHTDNTVMVRIPKLAAGTYMLNISVPGQVAATRKFLVE